MKSNLGRSTTGIDSAYTPPYFFLPLIPTLPAVAPLGQIYYQTSDNKLYTGDGTNWKKIENKPIGTDDILDGAVTNPKLATASSTGAANNVVLYDNNGAINTNLASANQAASFQSNASTLTTFIKVGSSTSATKNVYVGWDQTNNWLDIGQAGVGPVIIGNPVQIRFNAFVGAATGSVPVIFPTTGQLVPNLLLNSNIDPSAAIAYSKLNLSDSILGTDINSAAAIPYSKLNLSNSLVNGDYANGQIDPIKTTFMDAMASINGNGTIAYSYGISGVVKNSAGNYTITFNNASFKRVPTVTTYAPGTYTAGLQNLTTTKVDVITTTGGTQTDCLFLITSIVFS